MICPRSPTTCSRCGSWQNFHNSSISGKWLHRCRGAIITEARLVSAQSIRFQRTIHPCSAHPRKISPMKVQGSTEAVSACIDTWTKTLQTTISQVRRHHRWKLEARKGICLRWRKLALARSMWSHLQALRKIRAILKCRSRKPPPSHPTSTITACPRSTWIPS